MKVFRLEKITYRTPKRRDGCYSTYVDFVGVYSSVKSAEKMIRAIVGRDTWEQRVGFWLFENTVDGGFVGPFDKCCEYDSVRAYLADGSRMCESLCDDACVKEFKGRDQKTLTLKPGDVGYWVGLDFAEPILIEKTPPDMDYYNWVKTNIERRTGKRSTPGWDCSDDSYMAYLCRGSHDHPMVWQVFPAWGTVAKRVRERLAKTKKWHDDQDAAYIAECERRKKLDSSRRV